jgi:hypothetical protein
MVSNVALESATRCKGGGESVTAKVALLSAKWLQRWYSCQQHGYKGGTRVSNKASKLTLLSVTWLQRWHWSQQHGYKGHCSNQHGCKGGIVASNMQREHCTYVASGIPA